MRDVDLMRLLLGELAPSRRQIREQVLSVLTGGFGASLSNTGHFLLEDPDGPVVGLAAFSRVNWRSGCAWHDIYVPAALRTDSRMRDVHALVLQYAFDELNLHRTATRIPADDPALGRIIESLGGRREVVLNKHMTRDGQSIDLHVYGVLRREFTPHAGHEDQSHGA